MPAPSTIIGSPGLDRCSGLLFQLPCSRRCWSAAAVPIGHELPLFYAIYHHDNK